MPNKNNDFSTVDALDDFFDKPVTLVDDNGDETLYKTLFAFESPDFGKSYMLLVPADSEPEEQVEVLAYIFDPKAGENESELQPIEDDAEWDMVEGVLDTFLNDEKLQ